MSANLISLMSQNNILLNSESILGKKRNRTKSSDREGWIHMDSLAYMVGAGIAIGIFLTIKRWWQKFYHEDGRLDKFEEWVGNIFSANRNKEKKR